MSNFSHSGHENEPRKPFALDTGSDGGVEPTQAIVKDSPDRNQGKKKVVGAKNGKGLKAVKAF
jgi:hypothetical protein